MSFLGLISVELITSLTEIWQQNPLLFSIYAIGISIILAWAGKVVFGEYRKLKQFKSLHDKQQTAQRLKESMQTGEATLFIQGLDLGNYYGLEEFNQVMSKEHNDAELITLFEQTILINQDMKAKKIVHKYAAESALLLAVSPLAILDMTIILLRNQKMLTELAECYGVELGYASRVKLIRSIISNILFAGTSEVITDLGSQMLSLELTGKLSAKLGQGLAGGLLTARLGYQAMGLFRPIEFNDTSKPKLINIHKVLLFELKNISKNK